jgi:hypothetical protein
MNNENIIFILNIFIIIFWLLLNRLCFCLEFLILLTIYRGLVWCLRIRLIFIIVGVMPQYLGHWCWSRINSWLYNKSSSRIMIVLKHLDTSLVVTLSIVGLYWSCSSIIVYLLSEWTACTKFIHFCILLQILWILNIYIRFLRFRNSSVDPIYFHHLFLYYILFLFLCSRLLFESCVITRLLLFNHIQITMHICIYFVLFLQLIYILKIIFTFPAIFLLVAQKLDMISPFFLNNLFWLIFLLF